MTTDVWTLLISELAEYGHCRVFSDPMERAKLIRSQMGMGSSSALKPLQRFNKDGEWLEVEYAVLYGIENAGGPVTRVAVSTRRPHVWDVMEYRDGRFQLNWEVLPVLKTPEELILDKNAFGLYSRADAVVFHKNTQDADHVNGWIENIIGGERMTVTDWSPSRPKNNRW